MATSVAVWGCIVRCRLSELIVGNELNVTCLYFDLTWRSYTSFLCANENIVLCRVCCVRVLFHLVFLNISHQGPFDGFTMTEDLTARDNPNRLKNVVVTLRVVSYFSICAFSKCCRRIFCVFVNVVPDISVHGVFLRVLLLLF